MAQIQNWLRRPTSPAVGYAAGGHPPRCLSGYSIVCWGPRVPLDVVHGLPVWAPETLIAFMGARPGKFPWSDIAEWLWEPCENIDPMLVATELEGHPPAAWARAAYLICRGERPDAAAALVSLGPPLGDGPHYFGRRTSSDLCRPWLPVWVPEFKIVDYLLERNWSQDWT